MSCDADLKLGIDLGGTKIAGVILDGDGHEITAARIPTPKDDYGATIKAVVNLVVRMEQECGESGLPVGVGHPGALNDAGVIKNANSTCLNGRPLQRDLERALQRPIGMANDANCLAASEVVDGAAAGASPVFAVILGTGVGGAIAVDGRVVSGASSIAGEWGHNPLPWVRMDWGEDVAPRCWCGRLGCIETWLSGPGLAAEHQRRFGGALTARKIADKAVSDASCRETLMRHADRLARALAHVINLIDPDVIVLGGGVSQIQSLYQRVPELWAQWVFSDRVAARIVSAKYGDASGVRGAARLAS